MYSTDWVMINDERALSLFQEVEEKGTGKSRSIAVQYDSGDCDCVVYNSRGKGDDKDEEGRL